jgi:hypothetical protein
MEGRLAAATLHDSFRRVVVPSVPQKGVLSPILCCLVDDLIAGLNGVGVYTQRYADDISFGSGKIPRQSGIMQWALHTVETWCGETGLSVNPDKTELVVFTGKRKLLSLE